MKTAGYTRTAKSSNVDIYRVVNVVPLFVYLEHYRNINNLREKFSSAPVLEPGSSVLRTSALTN